MMCACRQHPLITPWLWCLHMHLHSLGSGLKHTPLDSGGVEKGSGICIFIKSLEDCNVFQDEEPVFCLLGSSMTSFLLGKVGKEVWGWHTRWVLQGWAIGRGLSSCRGWQNQGRGQNNPSSPSWKEVAEPDAGTSEVMIASQKPSGKLRSKTKGPSERPGPQWRSSSVFYLSLGY